MKFAIEIKTADGMRSSKSGCQRESLVQLIGLNASNERNSPPVILTNLVGVHTVFFLELMSAKTSPLKYCVREQKCKSFPSAVHFAMKKCQEASVTGDFSRPPTPTFT